MTSPFLSDAWFTEVEEIRAGLADQRAPLGWDVLDVNVVVTEPPVGDGSYHLTAAAGGFRLQPGHTAAPQAVVTMPYDIARALFVEGDGNTAIAAFFAGVLKVEGNVGALMPLQDSVTAPTGSRAQFHRLVQQVTAPD
jgi:hypothetical protein